jgi:hypothetical protein
LARLADALAQCLEAYQRSEGDLERCIAQHPELRKRLLPLLRLVESLPRLPAEADPSPQWREKTKQALLAKIEGEGSRGSGRKG